MKKVLSIILAIAMTLTLIPAVAAEGEASAAGKNFKVVYSLKQALYGGTLEETLTYENSGNRIQYVDDNCSHGFGWNKSYTYMYLNTGEYAVFKLNVPKAGTYNVNYEYLTMSNATGNVYIVSDLDSAVSGTADPVCATVAGSGDGLTSAEGTFTASYAGDYYLVIKRTGGNYYLRPACLTLTMGTGEGDAIMGTMEEELTIGETVTIRGYKSSVEAKTAFDDLYFESDNTSVAEVDKNGVVTAKAVGTATITTTSTSGAYPLTTTITVTDPTKATINYDLEKVMSELGMTFNNYKAFPDAMRKPISAITYEATDGFFKFKSGNSTKGYSTDEYSAASQSSFYEYRGNYIRFIYAGDYIEFEVDVPVSGTYKLSVKHPKFSSGGTMTVRYRKLADDGTRVAGQYNTAGGSSAPGNNMPLVSTTLSNELELEKGKYVFRFTAENNNYCAFSSFSLIAGTGNALLGYLDGDTTLEIGETANLKGFLSASGEAATVEYATSSDCVTVENGTITAVKPGNATVTMTETEGKATAGNTYTVDITVPDKAASDTVAYGTNINGTIKVVGSGIERGTDVTVTAPEISGKIFRHWVLGTEGNGTVVSTEAEHTFPLMTNTYLTAVYTDKPAEGAKLVEFFNWNGDYLSQSVLGENNSYTAPTPSLIGFSFKNAWLVDENKYLSDMTEFGSVTRAVAEFTPVGDYTVVGNAYTYDDEVTKTADQEMAWYRDDVLVGYGKEYTYNVWNNVETITSKAFTEKVPVVVLDDHIKDGNACMIEYDNGGKAIKEVGILFGTADATVDSADSKATSQWNEAHGQFTAKPRTAGNATHARGYIIYQDGTSYRVIYTDAIALANED